MPSMMSRRGRFSQLMNLNFARDQKCSATPARTAIPSTGRQRNVTHASSVLTLIQLASRLAVLPIADRNCNSCIAELSTASPAFQSTHHQREKYDRWKI
jgi:hypothetical protein